MNPCAQHGVSRIETLSESFPDWNTGARKSGAEMGIKSHPFGRVELTGDDAKTFLRQVRYGRPSKAERESARRSLAIARDMEEKGEYTFTVSVPSDEEDA